MISPWDADYLFITFRVSVHNVCCRRCDIPRLPGRRLTDCAIADTERADADPPGHRFRQAQLPKTP
jgi:hypothetical protein